MASSCPKQRSPGAPLRARPKGSRQEARWRAGAQGRAPRHSWSCWTCRCPRPWPCPGGGGLSAAGQGLQRASEWGDQSACAARGRRAAAAVATGVWWSGAGGARDLAASCCSACGAGSTAERVAVQRWRAVRRRLAPPTSAPPVGRRLLCQGPLTLAVLPVRSAGASAVPARPTLRLAARAPTLRPAASSPQRDAPIALHQANG
jgi:hypothetical protein